MNERDMKVLGAHREAAQKGIPLEDALDKAFGHIKADSIRSVADIIERTPLEGSMDVAEWLREAAAFWGKGVDLPESPKWYPKDKLLALIQEVMQEHPYKVPGNHDTYSDYNQGWEAALDTLEGRLG